MGYWNITGGSLAQSFQPSTDNLTGVSVGLTRMGQGSTDVTLNIREGTPTGRVVATAIRRLPDYAEGQPFDFFPGVYLEHFAFPIPAPVSPGDIYVIQLTAQTGGHGWVDPGYDAYADGTGLVSGQPTGRDFIFVTCGEGAAGKPCKEKTIVLERGQRSKPGKHECIDFNDVDCSP
jgi:hypothetical protein